jgi:hypothetical protein
MLQIALGQVITTLKGLTASLEIDRHNGISTQIPWSGAKAASASISGQQVGYLVCQS